VSSLERSALAEHVPAALTNNTQDIRHKTHTYLKGSVIGDLDLDHMNIGSPSELLCNLLVGSSFVADESNHDIGWVAGEVANVAKLMHYDPSLVFRVHLFRMYTVLTPMPRLAPVIR
jgi:hypothetical protein